MPQDATHAEFEEFQRWRAKQPASDPEKLITANMVKEICGGISDMSLWRWLRSSGFPPPTVINRRRYWRKIDVLNWLALHQRSA